MSQVSGRVGKRLIEWQSAPHGIQGQGRVKVEGQELAVRWVRDERGLWIELPHGTFGYDLTPLRTEEGPTYYSLSERGGAGHWEGCRFVRAGEEDTDQVSSKRKKSVRVRAQMPGKILKILVEVGMSVEKDQPLLVMEAMKMENEIRSPQAGKVAQLQVAVGHAVETGADLVVFE